MSTESVMPSNHLILCCSLLLLPSTSPSVRVFPNELALRIRWPKYWGFSFSPPSERGGGSIVHTTCPLDSVSRVCVFGSSYLEGTGVHGFKPIWKRKKNPVIVSYSLNIFQVPWIPFPKGSSFSPHTGRETREWCHFQRGHRRDRWEATPRWGKFLRAHPAQQRHPRHALLSGRDFWACGACYQVRPSSV